jgi:hypothetical protein
MTAAKLDATNDQFVVDLTDAADSHKAWLGIVHFGLNTLLGNQKLFAEVIVREAQQMAERDPRANVKPSDFICQILDELKLKLEVAQTVAEGGERA